MVEIVAGTCSWTRHASIATPADGCRATPSSIRAENRPSPGNRRRRYTRTRGLFLQAFYLSGLGVLAANVNVETRCNARGAVLIVLTPLFASAYLSLYACLPRTFVDIHGSQRRRGEARTERCTPVRLIRSGSRLRIRLRKTPSRISLSRWTPIASQVRGRKPPASRVLVCSSSFFCPFLSHPSASCGYELSPVRFLLLALDAPSLASPNLRRTSASFFSAVSTLIVGFGDLTGTVWGARLAHLAPRKAPTFCTGGFQTLGRSQ